MLGDGQSALGERQHAKPVDHVRQQVRRTDQQQYVARAHRLVAIAFGDGARVRIHDALPQQDFSTDLASVGVGLRYTGAWGLTGGLDWAYPLITTDRVAAGDSRLHMSVRYGF